MKYFIKLAALTLLLFSHLFSFAHSSENHCDWKGSKVFVGEKIWIKSTSTDTYKQYLHLLEARNLDPKKFNIENWSGYYIECQREIITTHDDFIEFKKGKPILVLTEFAIVERRYQKKFLDSLPTD